MFDPVFILLIISSTLTILLMLFWILPFCISFKKSIANHYKRLFIFGFAYLAYIVTWTVIELSIYARHSKTQNSLSVSTEYIILECTHRLRNIYISLFCLSMFVFSLLLTWINIQYINENADLNEQLLLQKTLAASIKENMINAVQS